MNNPDANTDWVKYAALLVSLLGGGAMGAFINNWFLNKRNKIPTIGIQQSINRVFAPTMLIKPKITFSLNDTEYHFENLYIVEIEVKNDSSQDYNIFDLKMALSTFARIIYMDCNGQDASHEIILKDKIGFENPCQIADITLNPFNRRNSYHISVYVTCSERSELTKNDIKYSSKIPAIFSAMEPVTETIAHY